MSEPKRMSETGTWRPMRPRAAGFMGHVQTIGYRLRWVVVYGDTVVARLILVLGSALWSIMLFLPGNTFERPVYANMAMIADEHVWASAWTVYGLALLWRTISMSTYRKWITFTINGAGVMLFGAASTCIVFSHVWPAPAATAGDISLSIVSVWLFMRSGLNNVPGWRDD